MDPRDEGSRDSFPLDPATQRWGLGDVLAGIAASLVLALFLGGVILWVAGWRTAASVPVWGQALLQLPLWGGYLGVTLFATREKGNGPVLDLGVRSTALDAPLGLLIGVSTQLVVLPLLYIPILRLSGATTEDLSAPARELASKASDLPGWILFAVIVGVGAPVVEELFYRGLFLRSLLKRGVSDGWAVLVTAAVFAGVHFQGLQFPGLFVFGLIVGALAVTTGRLGAAIWAHVGFNLTTTVILYLT